MITAPNGGKVPMIADGGPDIPDMPPRGGVANASVVHGGSGSWGISGGGTAAVRIRGRRVSVMPL
jgi:hypothetical protein